MVSFGGLVVSKVLFFTFFLCHCCQRVCSLDLVTWYLTVIVDYASEISLKITVFFFVMLHE